MGQQDPQREHALTTQPTGKPYYAFPIHTWMCAKQFRDIADPLQSGPAVFGSMHTEDQEHHLWRKTQDGAACQGDRGKSCLPVLVIQLERKLTVGDHPLKIHPDQTIFPDKRMVFFLKRFPSGVLDSVGSLPDTPETEVSP